MISLLPNKVASWEPPPHRQFEQARALSIVLLCVFSAFSSTCDGFQVSVTVPDGFSIKKVASDDLATNIYCLTVGPQGQVFVSGPGYIRRLLDRDRDGVFDDARTFAKSPASGAQGLWYGDGVLLSIGDGGLWRYPDGNQDGISDGNPELIIKLTTNGEHTAHAIREHHDGWFYLIAGNATAIRNEFFDGRFSPVKAPHAGFLMRMSPDFKTREVVAHGFRNAYDFDFNSRGEIFVYDSDGERDISLPWYRPTRVFRIQPGDDAGWVSEGWKRPSYFFDMPEEVGALGRGSPTGVLCYRNGSFPVEYDDALFVADWTFGRIVVFKMNPATGRYDRGSDFAIADGQYGFAVSDLAVAKDGSLLVTVGGRGTEGGVYRISSDRLNGKNESLPRAVPMAALSEPFSLRTNWSRDQTIVVLKALADNETPMRTTALEALVGRTNTIPDLDGELNDLLVTGIEKNLKAFEPQNVRLVHRLLSELDSERLKQIDKSFLSAAAKLLVELASCQYDAERKQLVENIARQLAESQTDVMTICRIGQLAFGGCGADSAPEMFKGYSSKIPLNFDASARMANQLATAIQAAVERGDRQLSTEIGRLAAMSRVDGRSIQEILVGQVGASSDPVEEIHWLNCIAQAGFKLPESEANEIANALANIDTKLAEANLKQDRNWVPRMRQLVRRLFQSNPRLAQVVQEQLSGRDGQIFLFDELPEELKQRSSGNFISRVKLDMEQATPNQLRVATYGKSDESDRLLREATKHHHLKEAAILSLALHPQSGDRELMLQGLLSKNRTLTRYSAMAIRRIADLPNPAEQLAAYKAASQMGWSKEAVLVRDQLIRLLQEQTKKDFGYHFKAYGKQQTEILRQWQEFLQRLYPKQFGEMVSSDTSVKLSERLARIDWPTGDIDRGRQIYRRLNCGLCHDGGSRLGPRLEGVTKRFKRDDLFRSIVVPSRQIPDRYRATMIETVDGLIFKGIAIYESVDGITLQDVNGATIRINQADIEATMKSDLSLMPTGLLDLLEDAQWADLYAYLRTL